VCVRGRENKIDRMRERERDTSNAYTRRKFFVLYVTESSSVGHVLDNSLSS